MCGVGSDSDYLTLGELTHLLNRVPGRVIVVLDSCFSGNSIYPKGISGSSEAEQFNQMVIEAFADADPGLDLSPAGNYGEKYGELRSAKFLVLTASKENEVSYNSRYNPIGGALTKGVVQGAGCSFPSGSFSGSIRADSNGDRRVSLNELHTYASRYVYDEMGTRQHVSCYPTNCTTAILIKK